MARKPKFRKVSKYYNIEYYDLGCFFVTLKFGTLDIGIDKWRRRK